MVNSLLENFEINHLLSTPYHPQTNGLVERYNRTLCESIAKSLIDNGQRTNQWDLLIPPTLFAYRTTKHSTTGIEPFYLVYGRNARLPVDQNIDNNGETTINARISHLIEKVPQIRESVKEKITMEQNKQKDRHDRKLTKQIHFEIEEKVLYFNVPLDQSKLGKLEPKWKGPYYVHNVLPNDAYKIRTIEEGQLGRVLSSPINGNLLKLYYEQ